MKDIGTLIGDIYKVLEGSSDPFSFSSVDVTPHLLKTLKPKSYVRQPNTLRFSEVGTPCPRALWMKVNAPEKAEKHTGQTLLKFTYGHCLEDILLALTEAAGHEVTGRQERAEIPLSNGWRVVGSLDAFVDGYLVDVKSVTKQSENKFKEGLNDENDAFAYRLQLSGYAVAKERTEAAFFTIGKELGNLGFYPIKVDKGWVYDRMEAAVSTVTGSLETLKRLDPVPDGRSGNEKLCTTCSYCGFKKECWPEARKFLYSGKPVWLTTVKKQPRVEEEIL